MQTAMGMLANNNKGDQVSSIAAIWAIYHYMIMGPPEVSVESQYSYCPNRDKTWCKYHKDKIFNRNIYDRSKCLPFVFRGELHVNVGPFKIRTSPLTTTKADLLFLFVNEMKWGSTWKKVIYGIIKRKIWSKCYCRTQMQGAK